MEKGTAGRTGKIICVALTGAESTGKSTLAKQLAEHYQTVYVPEYAREYVSALDGPYTYADVEHIGRTQISQKQDCEIKANRIFFLDTYLIITRVWFDVVFQKHPDWIDEELNQKTVDLYLLCDTDITWEDDPVRENGGEMRENLMQRYREELVAWNCTFRLVSGIGNERLQNAIDQVDTFLAEINENALHNRKGK
jgi:NadR type nicotinamide-nucleotide adenylyltransferase